MRKYILLKNQLTKCFITSLTNDSDIINYLVQQGLFLPYMNLETLLHDFILNNYKLFTSGKYIQPKSKLVKIFRNSLIDVYTDLSKFEKQIQKRLVHLKQNKSIKIKLKPNLINGIYDIRQIVEYIK